MSIIHQEGKSMIQVELTKSMIGRPEKHRRILRALGLTKMHRVRKFQDTPTTMGMIRKVSHMVVVTRYENGELQ